MRFKNFQQYQVDRWLQPSRPSPLYQSDVLSHKTSYPRRLWKWTLTGLIAITLAWFFL